jgi:tripartite-type tricarboxylate transporter receptor subunit TctC
MKYRINSGMRRILLAASAATCAVGIAAVPMAVTVSASTKSSCVSANGIKIKNNALVCQGLKFYKGQTMNFIEPASVGGPFDLQAQAEIPGLQSYLGVTINETRITTGNSIPGQDALAAAPANGLTIGELNPVNDASLILENQPGINFNPARLGYIAGQAASPVVLQALPSSNITTFAQWLSEIKAGTTKMVAQSTGTFNTVFRAFAASIGAITSANSPAYVTGYTSLTNEVTGYLRGDAPTGFINLSNTCSLLQTKQSVPLMVNVTPALGTNCRALVASLPTFASLEKSYAKTKAAQRLFNTAITLDNLSGQPTATQTGVPAYKLDALRAALQWTEAQSSFKTAMEVNGMNPKWVDPVTAKQMYISALSLGKTVICYVNSSVACAKA